MKLLLDANLSWRLVKKLQTLYPNTIHINQTGLQFPALDTDIFEFSKRLDFVILTFDEDYLNFSIGLNHPPKIILLKSIDHSFDKTLHLLNAYHSQIEEFYLSDDKSFLEIISS